MLIEQIINEEHQGKCEEYAEDKSKTKVVAPREERFALFLSVLDFYLAVFASGSSRNYRFQARRAFLRLNSYSHLLQCPLERYRAR